MAVWSPAKKNCRAQWTGGGSARSGCRRRSGRHRPRGARASRPALHPRGGARPGAMPAGDLPTLARGDPCRRLAARQKRCTATSSNPVPTSPPLDEPKNTRPTVEQRKKKMKATHRRTDSPGRNARASGDGCSRPTATRHPRPPPPPPPRPLIYAAAADGGRDTYHEYSRLATTTVTATAAAATTALTATARVLLVGGRRLRCLSSPPAASAAVGGSSRGHARCGCVATPTTIRATSAPSSGSPEAAATRTAVDRSSASQYASASATTAWRARRRTRCARRRAAGLSSSGSAWPSASASASSSSSLSSADPLLSSELLSELSSRSTFAATNTVGSRGAAATT